MDQHESTSSAVAAAAPHLDPAVTAETGRAQLRLLMRCVRDMVALKTGATSAPVAAQDVGTAGGEGPSQPQQQQQIVHGQMEVLQHQYEATRDALRSTFMQLDAAAGEKLSNRGGSATAHATGGMDVDGPGNQVDPKLAERHAQLVSELEQRNETIKELMDASRRLLEAMCMWQSHKKQLDLQHQAALR